MPEIRAKTPDPRVAARSIPIGHLQVTGTGTGSAQTLLTVRTGVLLVVKHLACVNTTSASATLSIHAVPSGGTIGTSNAEMISVPIPGYTTADLTDYIGQMYEGGATLQAYSGTSGAIVVHGWAEEIL